MGPKFGVSDWAGQVPPVPPVGLLLGLALAVGLGLGLGLGLLAPPPTVKVKCGLSYCGPLFS